MQKTKNMNLDLLPKNYPDWDANLNANFEKIDRYVEEEKADKANPNFTGVAKVEEFEIHQVRILTDVNDLELKTGFYDTNAATTNIPVNGSTGLLQVLRPNNGLNVTQIWYRYRDNQVYVRHYNAINTPSDGSAIETGIRKWTEWTILSIGIGRMDTVLNAQTINTSIDKLQETIDSLPKFLLRTVRITVSEGTLNEGIILERFHGPGQIYIFGAMSGHARTHMVRKILISDCHCPIELLGLTVTRNDADAEGVNGDSAIEIRNSTSSIKILRCIIEGTAPNRYGVYVGPGNTNLSTVAPNSLVWVDNCIISNKGRALSVDYGRMVAQSNLGEKKYINFTFSHMGSV